MNLAQLHELAATGEKIAMLTSYDSTFAKLSEEAGVDIILVGDSLGMVLQGAENTLNVSMHHMTYHTKSVSAGALNTYIIADMSLGSYEHDDEAGLQCWGVAKVGGRFLRLSPSRRSGRGFRIG